MKRSRLWVLLALIACIPVLLAHSTSNRLLQDSDTAFLLKVLRQRQAPLSWFSGDWPLQNHFYRPLPTLTFELDNRLYGNNPAGYGWTNCILCAFCVLGLFWLLAEFFRSPLIAFAGASIFALWTTDQGWLLSSPLLWIAGGLIVIGLYRHSLKLSRFIPATFVLSFLSFELLTPQVSSTSSLATTMIDWLPGRTASVMTFFALISMAAYLRFERARGRTSPAPATPFDVPRTTSGSAKNTSPNPHVWLGLSILATAAAFASYEQAVMLPAALLGLYVYLRLRRMAPDWRIHGIYWLMLGGYLLLRHAVIPAGMSHYQAQQFRQGPQALSDLATYVVPSASQVPFLKIALGEGPEMLLTTTVIVSLLAIASTLVTAFQAKRNWRVILAGWALSSLAYLPMAWLKQFGHYHYWPMALRTILILGVAKVAWDLVSIAVSPPELQAPPRPSPAPGSLPRP